MNNQNFRVLRGGCWLLDQRHARCAARLWFVPDDGLFFLGFRVVKSSKTKKSYVVRGGSWINGRVFARLGFRYNFDPDSRFNVLGFRVISN